MWFNKYTYKCFLKLLVSLIVSFIFLKHNHEQIWDVIMKSHVLHKYSDIVNIVRGISKDHIRHDGVYVEVMRSHIMF